MTSTWLCTDLCSLFTFNSATMSCIGFSYLVINYSYPNNATIDHSIRCENYGKMYSRAFIINNLCPKIFWQHMDFSFSHSTFYFSNMPIMKWINSFMSKSNSSLLVETCIFWHKHEFFTATLVNGNHFLFTS